MRKEKGEAAFESADDVLAGETVSSGAAKTRELREEKEVQEPAGPSTAAGENAPETPEQENTGRTRNIIIAACIGIALLVLACLCFRGCRKWCRR